MAFTVEDGSQPAGANAYMTVAEFKTHHSDRGVEAITNADFTDSEIQAGIVNATDYIDKRFGRRFRGWRRSRSQSLEWPRTDAYDDDDYLLPDIPDALKKGCAEYALLQLQLGRNLAPPPDTGFSTIDPETGEVEYEKGTVTGEKEQVGPILTETRYSDGGGFSSSKPMTSSGNLLQQIPEYPQADLWMEELLRSYGSRGLIRG